MVAAVTREGLVYGRNRDADLHCDVYWPAQHEAGGAAVILLPGANRPPSAMQGLALALAGAGFVCFAVEYRLPGQYVWPTQIQNVKAVIRWCRSRSGEFGIDPLKIAALGSSAGGHLALLAAGTRGLNIFDDANAGQANDERLAAVIALYPPVLFYAGAERPEGGFPMLRLMGDAATPEAAHAASPLSYTGPGFPPVFLIHGTADEEVPCSASLILYRALADAGVPVELHLYAGQPHGFGRQAAFTDLIATESAQFLRRYLGSTDLDQTSLPAAEGG